MGRECFICAGEAPEQYTLLFATDKVLKEQWMCDACYADFSQIDWIEITDSPVIMRGEAENGDVQKESR